MRRVIVSGGSRGIGAATVEQFALLGDKVAFIYRSDDESAEALSHRTGAFAVKADVSCADSAVAAFKSAVDYLGGIDILVSNAGIAFVSQICDTDDLQWKKIIDTNLSGAFYLSREASKLMVREHFGRIINIGSVWGKCGSSCEVAYSASKAGVRGLTMALAKELAPSGITVNCVEPGIIDTDMNSCFDENTLSEIAEEIPCKRLGKPDEVAKLIAFLASDEAEYINGQCIAIDGGWCI
ncbi:MAG: 3-oxoacyl-ACP reductase FabG [Clostridia bacterium]|nr:3-oxoacyl-ACP reductase FabG [Clostridia bacterium]